MNATISGEKTSEQALKQDKKEDECKQQIPCMKEITSNDQKIQENQEIQQQILNEKTQPECDSLIMEMEYNQSICTENFPDELLESNNFEEIGHNHNIMHQLKQNQYQQMQYNHDHPHSHQCLISPQQNSCLDEKKIVSVMGKAKTCCLILMQKIQSKQQRKDYRIQPMLKILDLYSQLNAQHEFTQDQIQNIYEGISIKTNDKQNDSEAIQKALNEGLEINCKVAQFISENQKTMNNLKLFVAQQEEQVITMRHFLHCEEVQQQHRYLNSKKVKIQDKLWGPTIQQKHQQQLLPIFKEKNAFSKDQAHIQPINVQKDENSQSQYKCFMCKLDRSAEQIYCLLECGHLACKSCWVNAMQIDGNETTCLRCLKANAYVSEFPGQKYVKINF